MECNAKVFVNELAGSKKHFYFTHKIASLFKCRKVPLVLRRNEIVLKFRECVDAFYLCPLSWTVFNFI